MNNITIAIIAVIIILVVMYYAREEDDGKPKFVFFSATWCPHCTEFQSTWDSLPQKLKDIKTSKMDHKYIDKIKEGLLDGMFVQIPHTKARKYNVSSYPTLRLYPHGLNGKYIEYKDERDPDKMVLFIVKNI